MKKFFSLKILVIITIIFSSLILLTSCGTKTEKINTNIENPVTINQKGQFSGNSPDLYGEVKSISENNITIDLLEIQQRQQLTDEQRQQMQNSRNNNQNQGNENPNQNTNNNGVRNRNGFQGGQGGRLQGNAKKYTGKSETIIVEANTPITTFSRNNGNFSETTLSLSDIKVGSLVQIWYKKDSTTKEIQNIRLIQSFNNNNNSSNENNNSDNVNNSANSSVSN